MALAGLWRCPSQVGSPESELCHVLVNTSMAGRPQTLALTTPGSATAGHGWLGCTGKTKEKRSLFATALSAVRLGLCSLRARGWSWRAALALAAAPVLLPSTPAGETSLPGEETPQGCTGEQLVSSCQEQLPSWDSEGGSRVCPWHPHSSGAPARASCEPWQELAEHSCPWAQSV